jgi:hypothetical protein
MATVELHIPLKAVGPGHVHPLAPRVSSPSDATLLLICNGKPRARELLTFVGEELQKRLDISTVEIHQKPAASTLLEPELVATLAARSTFVVTGVGDCGSCSACSLHDAVQFEKEGTPATLVLTTVFEQHVESFARNLGMPGYPVAPVRHLVSSLSDDELRQVAADVAPLIASRLTRQSL